MLSKLSRFKLSTTASGATPPSRGDLKACTTATSKSMPAINSVAMR